MVKNKKGEVVTTNPNGANQYLFDPRQKLCWELYVDPKSDTFGNALRSAIKAGYEERTAVSITSSNWFQEKTRRLNLLGKAERVLDETLEMSDEDEIIIDGTPLGIKRRVPALTKIKQDTAKFIAERQGKDEGYSTRNEGQGPTVNITIESLIHEYSAKRRGEVQVVGGPNEIPNLCN